MVYLTSSLDVLMEGVSLVKRQYYCCQLKCFKAPKRLKYFITCTSCEEYCFCMCKCKSFAKNKWVQMENACRRCWNKHIEECGCDGKAEDRPKIDENTKYCCPEKCCVIPDEKIEGMKCLICENEGYCNCRCVNHRLSRYRPDKVLEEWAMYNVVDIQRKFVEPPLFYNPLAVSGKYRYQPFHFTILTFRSISRKYENVIIIPPEITKIGFTMYPEHEPTFETIKGCTVFAYQGRRDFRFYISRQDVHREYNADMEEATALHIAVNRHEREALQYMRETIPGPHQLNTVIGNESFFGVD